MTPLPLDDSWPEIEKALKSHRNLVLVAEPGAGKTTRFPPGLLRANLIEPKLKVLMLEPRRIAARASAARIADEQNWRLGGEVGYQVRFENKTSAETRLQILTEGLLGRRLQSESDLGSVGAVILDEFHERSLHTDLAIGLLRELQELARPDLRIIAMSATLDAEKVSKFLGDAPIVKVPGRTHPVAIHHTKKPFHFDTGPAFIEDVGGMILDLFAGRLDRRGDVLVFLPGTREIRRVRETIEAKLRDQNVETLELHGSLALDEQERALRPAGQSKRVVLATNIAETSLTLDGIGTVLDTGLARVMRSDAAGFSRLLLSRISLASATQRSGRAGRQAPGISYRLWSKLDEASMSDFEVPELLRSDLSETLMLLASQGVTDANTFSWFDAPTKYAVQYAERTLNDLEFRDPQTGQLTNDGRLALQIPLDVRPAKLLLEAAKRNESALGAKLAALITEKDIVRRALDLKRVSRVESDVMNRLYQLESPSLEIDRFARSTVQRVADQLESIAGRLKLPASTSKSNDDQETLAMKLIMLGYADRIARRRRSGENASLMLGNRGIELSPQSTIEKSEFFVAIDSMEPPPGSTKRDPVISLASAVDKTWLEERFAQNIANKRQIVFDRESKSVVVHSARMLHDLPLENPKVAGAGGEEAFPVLLEEGSRNWNEWFAAHEEVAGVLARIKFLEANSKSESFFDLEEAKSRFLEEVCYGETKLSSVFGKSLKEAFLRNLPSEVSSLLGSEVPETLTVPSGSRLRVHYPEARSPYLEVRIQEVFGWTESPRIARGTVPIQLHLLGPNYRPVQVTSDLKSFWQNGYPEVRKELRTRYPKHSWPENPLTAKAEAKGRPQRH